MDFRNHSQCFNCLKVVRFGHPYIELIVFYLLEVWRDPLDLHHCLQLLLSLLFVQTSLRVELELLEPLCFWVSFSFFNSSFVYIFFHLVMQISLEKNSLIYVVTKSNFHNHYFFELLFCHVIKILQQKRFHQFSSFFSKSCCCCVPPWFANLWLT